jgi:hypothetical protein
MKIKLAFRPLDLFVAVCALALVIKALVMHYKTPHSQSPYLTEMVGLLWGALSLGITAARLSCLPGGKMRANVLIALALFLFSFVSYAIISA